MNSKIDFTSNDIIHLKENTIEFLQFKKLNEFSNKIKHLITLRHGGVSDFPVDTLNFRLAGNDKKENVFQNLKLVTDIMNISKEQVFKGKQAHTDNILIINNSNKNNYKFEDISQNEFDGYICNQRGIATLVTTADCNPIIIYDYKKNIYANIHSGWKGTIKQIYLKAVHIMHEKFNINYSDLMVCVGPSIKKCCFSSEDESFKKQFTDIWKDDDKYIYYEDNSKRFHIDLSYVIKKDFLNIGIKEDNIIIPDICTKCNSNSFFSYREARQKGYKDYGTMATIVYLL